MYQFSSLTQGEDTFFFNLASSLSERGHEVHVITSDQLPLIGGRKNLTINEVHQRLNGASIREFPFFGFMPLPSSIIDIAKILVKCDLLYTRNEFFELFPLSFLRGKLNIPIVCGIHTYIKPHNSVNKLSLRAWLRYFFHSIPIYRNLLRQCNVFHTLNEFDSNLLITTYDIMKKDVFLIPLGIDTALFSPHKIDRTENIFKILFVGRLDEGKGVDILYQAIRRLNEKEMFKKISFTIVGDGKLRYLTEQFSLMYPNVKYLGHIPHHKLAEVYNSHDIVVLPSRWETFSYICIEAQSCGLPVIATAIPGPGNIIKHEKTGLLIPPNSGEMLMQAIMRLFRLRKDKNAFNLIKKRSRKEVLQNYSLTNMIDTIELLFMCVSTQKKV